MITPTILGTFKPDMSRVVEHLRVHGVASSYLHTRLPTSALKENSYAVITEPLYAISAAMTWTDEHFREINKQCNKIRVPGNTVQNRAIRAMQFWYHWTRLTVSIAGRGRWSTYDEFFGTFANDHFGIRPAITPQAPRYAITNWDELGEMHAATASAVATLARSYGFDAPNIDCPSCGGI